MSKISETYENILNAAVAEAISLKLQAKQSHWNIRGKNFLMWHELFDSVATLADTMTDSLAERVVQQGGTALGLAAHLPNRNVTEISETHAITLHANAVLAQLENTSKVLKAMIDTAEDNDDPVSADLATSNLAEVDKLIWFISAHKE